MRSILTNDANRTIADYLDRSCGGCKEIKIAVGFLLMSGASKIVRMLKNKEICLECVTVIFGTSFNITEPNALRYLYRQGVNLWQYQGREIYHPKVYYFKKKHHSELLIGSANMSEAAWMSNIEAMIYLRVNGKSSLAREVDGFFKYLEEKSVHVSEKTIATYESNRQPVPYVEGNRSSIIKVKQERDLDRKETSFAKKLGIKKFDQPQKMIFKGKNYVFTGRFYFGNQEECMHATKRHGGFCNKNNSWHQQTDVLVVGARGSSTYKWKEDGFGLKIRNANSLREGSGKPIIVLEDRWKQSLQK